MLTIHHWDFTLVYGWHSCKDTGLYIDKRSQVIGPLAAEIYFLNPVSKLEERFSSTLFGRRAIDPGEFVTTTLVIVLLHGIAT